MNLRFYCDLWPANIAKGNAIYASTHPVDKPEGCVRIAFNIVVPDDVVAKVDYRTPYEPSPEIVK